MTRKISLIWLLLTFCIAYHKIMSMPDPGDTKSLKYLALGDSYTIGESVSENERWPIQLSTLLQEDMDRKIKTTIIAKTGWTTDELITAVDEAKLKPAFDLVSLLIGVNNQYRGNDIHQYQEEFGRLLKTALGLAGGNKKAVFVLSIPDYGVTPFARDKNPKKIAFEIDEYNKMAEVICIEYGIAFYDITKISRKARNDGALIADDGLHPSAKMYHEWAEKVFPKILKLFK